MRNQKLPAMQAVLGAAPIPIKEVSNAWGEAMSPSVDKMLFSVHSRSTIPWLWREAIWVSGMLPASDSLVATDCGTLTSSITLDR